jgi:hypothetical protein
MHILALMQNAHMCALFDGRIEGAVITVSMHLQRDLVIIVLQGYNLSLPMRSDVAQLRARFMAGAAIAHNKAAPQWA